MNDFPAGMVWLVGAGPGDPELLTGKAARLIGAASIIFHDALVGPAVLALARKGTRLVAVGKRAGRHSHGQDQINALIVRAAQAGERVVRLKGGDVSIFGRVAEELEALAAAGMNARICPGITAASAAAASLGTSLTLRGTARALCFVTAYARAGEPLDLDWARLADPDATLAIYMGKGAAAHVAAQLMQAGMDPATPAALVENASLPTEKRLRTRLDSLGLAAQTVLGDGPAILLIGAALCTGQGQQQRSHPYAAAPRHASLPQPWR